MFLNLLFFLVAAVFIIILVLLTILLAKFLKNKRLADKEWDVFIPQKISDFGSVDNLTLLPIIDWYTSNNNLKGEPGVSWLIRTNGTSILMDVGVNLHKEEESPLLRNMKELNVGISELSHIFISHLHMDHVGGLKAQKEKTIKFSTAEHDLSNVTIYAPTFMKHNTASVKLIDKQEVLFPGIASEGPISRSLFAMGLTKEHALVVNVRGKGLILIVGCGHQGLQRIIERAEQIFTEPIYGLIGGLHYPVTQSRIKLFGLPMQKFIGTGKPPWQNVSRDDVRKSIEYLKTKNLGLISISAHDSCDWTIEQFRKAFNDTYVDLKVGSPIIIN